MTTDDKLKQIAKEIKMISASMRRFRDGPLSRRCIEVLLKDTTGIPLTTIKKVLDGVDALEDEYLNETR